MGERGRLESLTFTIYHFIPKMQQAAEQGENIAAKRKGSEIVENVCQDLRTTTVLVTIYRVMK